MEIILLFITNFIILFFKFDKIPKINIDIFTVVLFFIFFFLFIYKKYYLSSRRKLIVFSSLIGILLGELQIKEVLVLKKGTVEQMLGIMVVILLFIIILEIKELKKH